MFFLREKELILCFFLLFTASVQSRSLDQPLVPGVFFLVLGRQNNFIIITIFFFLGGGGFFDFLGLKGFFRFGAKTNFENVGNFFSWVR